MTGRAKACTECRQQKLKCDARLDPHVPCSRCRRTGIECVISNNFQRSKRSSKAEMQRELDQLRALAGAAAASQAAPIIPPMTNVIHPPTPISTVSPSDPSIAHSVAGSTSSCHPPHSPQPSDFITHQDIPQARRVPIITEEPSPLEPEVYQSRARTIDGFELSGQKIADCMEIYFERYHHQCPIIDPGHTPDQYYLYSPLVFWVLVATGSRRYQRDPTILDRLSQPVTALALSMTARTSQYIQVIQALTLLCSWPFPVDTIYHDVSLVFAGAAMQLSIQNGLHMFSRRQDFTRNSLRKDEAEEIFRAKLWCYSKIICQGLSVFSGLWPFVVPDAFDQEQQHKSIISGLPPVAYWRQKLHTLFTKCMTTLMSMTSGPEESMDSNQVRLLVDVFDGQLQDLAGQAGAHLLYFEIITRRLYLRVFDFYVQRDATTPDRMAVLYSVACALIRELARLDKGLGDSNDDVGTECSILHSSHIAYRVMSLAGSTILRIVRSGLIPQSSSSSAEEVYFTGVRLLRKRSLQNDDLDARQAVLQTQLWRSTRVFTLPDGSVDSLKIRMRSRGAMSVNYDCYWYWVVEFKRQSDPYSPHDTRSTPGQSTGSRQDIHVAQNFPAPAFLWNGDEPGMDQAVSDIDGFWPPWEWPVMNMPPPTLHEDII